MGTNDQRTRATKRTIRRAFTGLLRRKPIQSISVKELCASAGVSRGTFYAHYTGLYDLLGQLEEELMEAVRRGLSRLLEGPPEARRLLEVTAELFRTLGANADLCAMVLGPNGDKEFARRLVRLGREYFTEAYRLSFPQATPKQLGYYYAFVSSGCVGLLETWLGEGMATSAEEMAALAEGIMRDGMGFFQNRGER